MALLKTKYENQTKDSMLDELESWAQDLEQEANNMLRQAETIRSVKYKLDGMLEDVDENSSAA